MATELDISLKNDDDVFATISMTSVNVCLQEMKKLLTRCESRISDTMGAGAGRQAVADMIRRREKLMAVIEDLSEVEAQVRLRNKESS